MKGLISDTVCSACRIDFGTVGGMANHCRYSKTCTHESRFWGKVQRRGPDDCWHWLGRRDTSGYGRADRKGPMTYAHRCAWLYTNGPIPDGMEVAHRCDERDCCNPKHYFLATHQENMDDCVAKGRQTKGEKNPSATLTPALVLDPGEVLVQGQEEQHQGAGRRVPASNARRDLLRCDGPLLEASQCTVWRWGEQVTETEKLAHRVSQIRMELMQIYEVPAELLSELGELESKFQAIRDRTPPEAERSKAFTEAANIVLAMKDETVTSKYATADECRAARNALWSAAEGLQAAAKAINAHEPQNNERKS